MIGIVDSWHAMKVSYIKHVREEFINFSIDTEFVKTECIIPPNTEPGVVVDVIPVPPPKIFELVGVDEGVPKDREEPNDCPRPPPDVEDPNPEVGAIAPWGAPPPPPKTPEPPGAWGREAGPPKPNPPPLEP